MAKQIREDVYERYQRLAKDNEWKDHLHALPALILAHALEECTNKLIVQARQRARDGKPGVPGLV
jgi:hypothetical protein